MYDLIRKVHLFTAMILLTFVFMYFVSGYVLIHRDLMPEGKTVKNRLHLGCNAGTLAELEVELNRLQSLGATIAWEEEFPPEIAARYRNVILRDIEGNEFCLGAGGIS